MRDPDVQRRVLHEVAVAVPALRGGARVAGVVDSGLPGPARETANSSSTSSRQTHPRHPDDLDDWIDGAVGGAVRRAAVLTHGRPRPSARLSPRRQGGSGGAGVELVFPQDEGQARPLLSRADPAHADVAVRPRRRRHDAARAPTLSGTGIPAIGVKFGRVGFLTSIAARSSTAAPPRLRSATTGHRAGHVSRSARRRPPRGGERCRRDERALGPWSS